MGAKDFLGGEGGVKVLRRAEAGGGRVREGVG